VKGHIVVTGCAGFSESHLADRLPADGQAVVGVDSFVQSRVRALRLSALAADIRVVPNRR